MESSRVAREVRRKSGGGGVVSGGEWRGWDDRGRGRGRCIPRRAVSLKQKRGVIWGCGDGCDIAGVVVVGGDGVEGGGRVQK